MSELLERQFLDVLASLHLVVEAMQQREVWTSRLLADSLVNFMAHEAEDLADDRILYTFTEQPLSVAGPFDEMSRCLQRMRDEISNKSDSPAAVEARLWALIEEWLDARLSRPDVLAFERSTSHPTISIPDEVAVGIFKARDARHRARKEFENLRELHFAVLEADQRSKQALLEASRADEERRQAQDLAAKTGDTALSENFARLASSESEAASFWTRMSVGTTVVGTVFGLSAHAFSPFGSDTANLLYPLLLAVGAAGLATYFARLGGHHRHSAQWAKSISVQLDSYAKFVQHTDNAGRTQVFDQFARRVLGPPPPRSEKSAVQSATIADIAAIVARNS